MRLKYGFLSMIVGLTLMMVIGVNAQSNVATCPTLVQESFTATEFLCESVPDGQACLGNGVVTTTPLEGASIQFSDPGDLATLADMSRLAAQTINTESQALTSITAKLEASTPNGDPQVVDMLIFGDAVVSNALEETAVPASGGIFSGTVEAGGGVIVRQDANVNSNNIWQLLNGESIQAIGRSSDNQWVRILIPSPNGGAGWIFGQFVSIEGGRELLPFQTNTSPVPESGDSAQPQATLKSMQVFRLESLLTDPGCIDTPDSGVILQSPTLDTRALVEVNGVALRFRGTVYITAQVAGTMTIYNLEGETAVIIEDNRVDMATATMVEVPLDASLAPTDVPTDPAPYPQEVADELIFLPIRLLSRNFEITVVDPSEVPDTSTDTTSDTTDTSEPSEQEAPPPPAATEIPPEETIDPEECPTLVQESYTATEQLCDATMPNTACLGNAGTDMVTAVARDEVETFQFSAPNDKEDTTNIDTLSTRVFDDPNNSWTSTVMTLDAKTTTGGTVQATILVFGEVELENTGEDPVETDTTSSSEAPPPAIPAANTDDTSQTTDTTTTDSGAPATIQSPGGIIVRPEPRVDSATVGQLQDGDAVSALGRSVDQQWVQVQSEDGVTGWIFVQFVSIEGGAESLPIIDPSAETSDTAAPPPPATNQSAPPPPASNANTSTGEEPEYTSMQSFEFSSTGIPSECIGSHSSGVMIQSPDDMDGNLRLKINDIVFEINGTIYASASLNENINVISLEGETIITAQDTSQTIMAGQQSTIELTNGLEPDSPPSLPGDYSFSNGERFATLPIRLLPRGFEVIIPPEPEGSDEGEGVESSDDSDESSDTSTDDGVINVGGTTVDFDADCVMSAGDSVRNLRADAGREFDVINTLPPGQTIEAKTQKRGTDGVYWYETARGWIRSDAGIPTDDCKILPLTGVIYDTTASGGNVAAVAPVAPAPPAQPTSPPPPPVTSELLGNVCETPGYAVSIEQEVSGRTFVEFGGVWTGQAGRAVTFTAEVPYYRPELGNILTFVNEDGSVWLGSIDSPTFTINFDSNRRFRVRVSALLGDFVTLRVSC